MYRGQIVELGKSYEIYKHPKHPYTEKLVTSIPNIKNKENRPQDLGEKSQEPMRKETGCKFYDCCPYAKEKCRNDPPVINHEDGYIRCWLYD